MPDNRGMLADRPTWHTTRLSWARDSGGQTTIIVALSIVVLLGALALGTEWGFALTQRRLAQNAADAGALAGAQLLAGNVRGTSSGVVYTVREEDVYCRAVALASSNLASFRPGSHTDTLTVEWAGADGAGAPLLPWRAFAPPAGGASACPSTTKTTQFANPSTVFVRATPTLTYPSLIASVVGQSTITASAKAVARIVGRPIPVNGPSWPMVRHFNIADFASGTCGPNPPCNPTAIPPVTFWSTGNSPNITYNNFMGLVDFSRYSPNANSYNGAPPCDATGSVNTSTKACVPQLFEQWDKSGLAPSGKSDLTHFFSGGTPCTPPAPAQKWFTAGLESPQNADKQCSLENWIAWGFGGPQTPGETGPRGELSLEANRHSGLLPVQEAPAPIGPGAQREVCQNLPNPNPLPVPSCADQNKGDWVETAQTGNVGNNVAAALQYFIDHNGSADSFEHVRTGPGNGAPEYGKKVVINVYLWDCAESFSGTTSGNNQWSLITPSGGGNDCSDIHGGNDIGNVKVDRVHLFSVAPFTFYRGLVSGSLIQGFWGGIVSSDPGPCATNPTLPGCQINPFSNAVFLVAAD
ncbi:MAG: pilus assembly protein TadG-related protein [Deltaproteobacteria bacterium]